WIEGRFWTLPSASSKDSQSGARAENRPGVMSEAIRDPAHEPGETDPIHGPERTREVFHVPEPCGRPLTPQVCRDFQREYPTITGDPPRSCSTYDQRTRSEVDPLGQVERRVELRGPGDVHCDAGSDGHVRRQAAPRAV